MVVFPTPLSPINPIILVSQAIVEKISLKKDKIGK
jgi:hypothetical protein